MNFHTSQKSRTTLLSRLLVCAIVMIGLFVRTIDVNWDQNQHLHPDERFLTMVMGNMVIPKTFSAYLNPDVSTFNPVNVGNAFFVYGTFPLVVNKLFAVALHLDDYVHLTILGRSLSGITDAVSIGILILIAREFERKYSLNRNLKYFAGLFYAISVLPIQQSHFFTVDTFANTFFLWSFLFALKTDGKHFIKSSILSGIFLGLAVASKVNLVLAGPLIGWFSVEFFFLSWWQYRKKLWIYASFLGVCSLWFLSFWVTLRVADPYYFAKFSLVDAHPNQAFVKNIQSLQALSDPNGYFPPGIQWVSKKPIIFPLVNIAIYGLGLPLFIFSLFGMGKIFIFAVRGWKKRIGILMMLGWMLAYFVYEGTQFVLTMRYFLFLYPLFALCAGFGVIEFGARVSRKVSLSHKHHEKVVMVGVLTCFIWPLMFMSIYLQQNSRVRASLWMYKVIPDKSVIALEHWDDPIPLSIEGGNPEHKQIDGIQLPVFYEDVDVKWTEMTDTLTKVDYYVLTSNRGWGSIMAAPKKYPKMAQFYQDLFDEKTEFTKIAEFSSYPSLSYLGIPFTFNDDWSEEAFTVYDHPKVMIYAKRK